MSYAKIAAARKAGFSRLVIATVCKAPLSAVDTALKKGEITNDDLKAGASAMTNDALEKAKQKITDNRGKGERKKKAAPAKTKKKAAKKSRTTSADAQASA